MKAAHAVLPRPAGADAASSAGVLADDRRLPPLPAFDPCKTFYLFERKLETELAPGRRRKLIIKRSIIFTACILACAIAAPAARAAWPDHPVRFIVGFGPGGANDLIARFAAEGVSKRLGQPGRRRKSAGRRRGNRTAYVAHSPPDGYTFLVGAASTITNSLILKDLPYAIPISCRSA